MATRPATIRPKPLNVPVLDNNPESNLKRTTTVPIFNGDTLARVLRPVISPQRMLGWSLGIVYLWFGALKLAHLSPVLELIRRTSPLLATAPFYSALALSELDRKSTRLNSSHLGISYAVFCLKKKNNSTPSSRSRSRMWRDSAGCATCR